MTALSLLFGPTGWGGLLLQGAVVTLLLGLSTLPVGFGIGLGLAALKRSKSRLVRALCEAYTTFFRGIPDLLALFIIYFGFQALLDKLGRALSLSFHLEVNAFVAGVLALGLIAGAYSSEVWVAAFQGVPKNQSEAASAIGLTSRQSFFLVVFPQLLRIALPGLGNVWTIMLKDTSLISTLAVLDLLRAASEASRATQNPLLFYSAAAGVYLLFSIGSALIQSRLERSAGRGYAR